jgi:hypothetical protein
LYFVTALLPQPLFLLLRLRAQDWRFDSSGRVPPLQPGSPEFKLQSNKKKKKRRKKKIKSTNLGGILPKFNSQLCHVPSM